MPILAEIALRLFILVAVVVVGNKLYNRKPKSKAPSPAPATKPAPAPASAFAAVPASAPTAAPVLAGGISGETVAAITAAVAMIMGETAPGAAYRIAGIQRSSEGRPVWAMAGLAQNTKQM